MREFYEESGYDQIIEMKNNKIIKYSCTCPDFQFRKLKKEGNGPDCNIICIGTCKHLRKLGVKDEKELSKA